MKRIANTVVGWSAVSLVFAAPTSRALFNISALIFLIAFIFCGDIWQKAKIAYRHTLFMPIALMLIIMTLGVVHTPAPVSDLIEHLRVYSKFGLILILAIVFRDAGTRVRAWQAFFLAMLFIVVSTYLNIFIELPWSKTKIPGFGVDHSVFTDYIVQGVVTSLFVVFCLQSAIESRMPEARTSYYAIGLASALSIVFLLQGRSGLVVLTFVLISWLFVNVSGRVRWLLLAAVFLCVLFFTLSSSMMTQRVTLAIQEIKLLKSATEESSSIGLRLHMWGFAFMQMLDNPFFGSGTGSYHLLAEKYFGHCNFTCFHPHNQYLFFGMENGLPGLFAYLFFLYRFYAMKIEDIFFKKISLYFLVVLVVQGLINAPLWYRMESYIFYAMAGLLASHVVVREE